MSFPKTAQRKGGRAAASDRQKTIAKQTIMETRPWEKSTGPTTQEGLQAVTGNVRLESLLCFGCVFESKDSAVKAPYSPQLNLIEILWRFMKYEWIELNAYESWDSLVSYV